MASLGAGAAGCAGTHAPIEGRPPVDEILAARPSVLWVAAHPDDESMAGSVLAHACVKHKATCHFLVLSRGEGGECCIEEGCGDDLGELRHQELEKAASLYGATLEHYAFSNSPLPVESFPTRAGLAARWLSEGDPVGLIARAIRERKVDVMFAFDHDHGFTGHPEHQATSRFALLAARVAADPASDVPKVRGLDPHRVQHVYQSLNHYWVSRLVGDADPGVHTEVVDGDETCRLVPEDDGDEGEGATFEEQSCAETGAEFTRAHRSQDSDMSLVRTLVSIGILDVQYLRALDPYGPEADAIVAEIEALIGGEPPSAGGDS